MSDSSHLWEIPVVPKTIEFAGDYAGGFVNVWLNPPQELLDEMASGDNKRQRAALAELILSSNMADRRTKKPIDFKDTTIWGRVLPWDLAIDIINGYTAAFNERATLPKAKRTPSSDS